jgi:hypothetical protein
MNSGRVIALILVFIIVFSCSCLQRNGTGKENQTLTEDNNYVSESDIQGSSKQDETALQTRSDEIEIEFISEIDYNSVSPMEFLELLKQNPGKIYTVLISPEGWIRLGDVQELVKHVDSDEPCARVVSVLSSYFPIEERYSTVGIEAMFLIEGFLKGSYPPALHSVSFDKKSADWYKDSLEDYWKENLNRLCDCVYLRSPGNQQLELKKVVSCWGTDFSIYRVHDQQEFEKAVDAIDKKVCLWVDVDAADKLDRDWLYEKAVEEKYPVLLIGNANSLYSFRDLLGIGSYISGPAINKQDKNRDGFSAYLMLCMEEKDNLLKVKSILKGFPGSVEIRELKAISQELLDGGWNFFQYDEKDLEQTLRHKYWNMKSLLEDPEAIKEVIQSLEGVNWSKLYSISTEDCFLIMDWFAERSKKGDVQALNALMINRKGLDAALAESYSWQMGNILELQAKLLVETLSKLEESDRVELIKFIQYNIAGRKEIIKKEIIKKLDQLLNDTGLIEKEKVVIENLLDINAYNDYVYGNKK